MKSQVTFSVCPGKRNIFNALQKKKKSYIFVHMRCDINFCSEQYKTIVPIFLETTCQEKQWLPSVAHLFSLSHFVTTTQILYRHKCSSPSGSMVVSFNKSNHDTKLLSVWHNRVTVREVRRQVSARQQDAARKTRRGCNEQEEDNFY